MKAGASGHPYAAAGIISLVQTTAYSLSGTGVRINAVCPGLIETGMTQSIFDRAKERGTSDKIGADQSAQARRSTGRDRSGGALPCQRRSFLREWANASRRRWPHGLDAVCRKAGIESSGEDARHAFKASRLRLGPARETASRGRAGEERFRRSPADHVPGQRVRRRHHRPPWRRSTHCGDGSMGTRSEVR